MTAWAARSSPFIRVSARAVSDSLRNACAENTKNSCSAKDLPMTQHKSGFGASASVPMTASV